MTDPIAVTVQDAAVLVEVHSLNESVLVLTGDAASHEHPLYLTCPWCKEKWAFHTQEQVDMLQKHLARCDERYMPTGKP